MRKEEPDWDPSSWYESFIDRHKDKLIARAVKGLKLERANPDIEDHFQDFVEFFGDWFISKGLSAKLLLNALKYCLDNGIHVVFFPTHSSHIIQPSDNRLFQVFKGLVQKKLQQKLLAARPSARDLSAELVGIAQEVELQLTSEVILAS